MSMNLKVAVIQPPLKEPESFVLDALAHLEDHHVAVLPEMWLTGFDTSPEALEKSSAFIERVKELSKGMDTLIFAGTFPYKEGEKTYNTSVVIHRGSIVHTRRKLYLFQPMGEDKLFCPGEPPKILTYQGVGFSVVICYELRFPDIFYLIGLKKPQIMVVQAQWPSARHHHWRKLLRARAIESQAFVIAANVVGKRKDLVFNGGSAVIHPLGETMVEANRCETVLSCSISLEEVEKYRKQIPVLEDMGRYGVV